MSILIKDEEMKMPKSCFECDWRCKVDPETILCRISGEYFDETLQGTISGRHKSCPLIELPPHGRCVDADKLRDVLIDYRENGSISPLSHMYAIRALTNADTIIEAEGVDDNG